MAFRIGKNFHIIHMTGDLRALDLWYYDVFSVRRFMPEGYLPPEKRDASLVLLGDLCVEPLAPAFRVEGWESSPLGRFYRRHGNRFHSLAWYVDEGMDELFKALRAADIDCRGTAGVKLTDTYEEGPVFTNPRNTFTQLEFIPAPDVPGGPAMLGDLRYEPGWSPSWWADRHPLQILNTSHVTLSTFELEKAQELYVDVLRGTLLHERHNPVIDARCAYVLVGEDLVVEIAQPAGDGLLKADMEQFHHGLYALTFKVRSLEDAKDHLTGKGVRFTFEDETTLVTDPATTQGVVMGFTTWTIPNDPRPDWTAFADGEPPAAAMRRMMREMEQGGEPQDAS